MKEYLSKVYFKSKSDYYKLLNKYLDNDEKKFIITANPEIYMESLNNETIKNMLLNDDNDIVPDGISIIKAAKKYGIKISERITGVDMTEELLKLLNEKNKTLYLFGASKTVLNDFKEAISNNYPNIKLLGAADGYVENRDDVFKKIIKLKPDVCLVALGVPNQELIINKYIDKVKTGLYIGVGGTFDVLSGHKKRAPKVFIKLNLEWLYRLIKEPSRIKRIYKNNLKFMHKVWKDKKN